MAYERYPRGQRDPRDYSADNRDPYASNRDDRTVDYQQLRAGNSDRGGYDSRSTGYYGSSDWNDRGGSQQRDRGRYGAYGDYGYRQGGGYQDSDNYRGGFSPVGQRFDDVEDYGREHPRDYGHQPAGRRDYGRQEQGRSDYGRQPQGYNYQERGFLDRAGDEVRSWFGDDDAERRREQDARYDQRYDRDRDSDYGNWRRGQIAALDRDYDEYRHENRSKFENEFSSWRTERQGQRSSLTSVSEHMDVVGSDGSHVGTVDKVRGDRIILTKSDADAGGRHHSIPSRWIEKVDDKVTLRKTADQAKAEWRDEERHQAFFSEGRGEREAGDDRGGHMLGRSFSGTY